MADSRPPAMGRARRSMTLRPTVGESTRGVARSKGRWCAQERRRRTPTPLSPARTPSRCEAPAVMLSFRTTPTCIARWSGATRPARRPRTRPPRRARQRRRRGPKSFPRSARAGNVVMIASGTTKVNTARRSAAEHVRRPARGVEDGHEQVREVVHLHDEERRRDDQDPEGVEDERGAAEEERRREDVVRRRPAPEPVERDREHRRRRRRRPPPATARTSGSRRGTGRRPASGGRSRASPCGCARRRSRATGSPPPRAPPSSP